MNPEIFKDQSEFFHTAAKATAEKIGCSEGLIYDCMYGLDGIWNTSSHIGAVQEVTHHFNDAANFARRLHRSLSLMTAAQRNELEVAGCVTIFQVEHLADVLATDAKSLKDWARTRIRTGGRNLAAYDIAELIRRVFRRQRKHITYGVKANSDYPSTAFGLAVMNALGDFGVQAGWRRPAYEAFTKQSNIQHSLMLICQLRSLKQPGEH